MKTISLANNKGICLVDDDSYAILIKYKWHIHTGGYAYAHVGEGKKKLMHQLILPGILIDHKNRDKLDNRKENLRAAPPSQNMAAIKHFGEFANLNQIQLEFDYEDKEYD